MHSSTQAAGCNYLQACLLLLLAEHPDHGYELTCRLEPFGLTNADTASTYRALRALERESAVTSTWTPSHSGPARRVYRLTAAGHTLLADCCDAMRSTQRRATRYLQRFDSAPPVQRESRDRAEPRAAGGHT